MWWICLSQTFSDSSLGRGKPLIAFAVSCLTLTVLLPATAAAAFFVQEEAVKAEGDTEDGEADEEDVKQAADEDESEDAETEKGCEHLVSTH